nr:hypothetical protein T459_24257 [Ipomoea batatas]GMC73834.1 hypothetical protein T459_24257 [Ipomoea batatas]GME01473.1 hypothetical protein T459_24257 [Ipomoea batatas]
MKRLQPIAAVLNAAKAWGCNSEPVTKPPPISVPPQYSITGLYRALPMSQRYSSTLDASPVEPKQRMVDQSKPAVQFVVFHVLTILGITPSIVTLASYINLANPELRGDPLYKAMDAPFNNEA